MTRVAEPVVSRSGSATPRFGAACGVGFGAGLVAFAAGRGATEALRVAGRDVLARADELATDDVAGVEVVLTGSAALLGAAWLDAAGLDAAGLDAPVLDAVLLDDAAALDGAAEGDDVVTGGSWAGIELLGWY